MSDYDDPPSGHTSDSYRRYQDNVEFRDQNDRNDYYERRQKRQENQDGGYDLEISSLYRRFLELRNLGFKDEALMVAEKLRRYGYTVD